MFQMQTLLTKKENYGKSLNAAQPEESACLLSPSKCDSRPAWGLTPVILKYSGAETGRIIV
jgi:hypothetical protein